ncbi:MAG TPA: tetratricopeptide repeat protein [Bryobacteraceae bacterium]|nr:tetratricopeptide repeat protein [Bryobacteraceae bacterium]
MKRKWTLMIAALAVCAAALSGTGCQKLKARDHLNKGVQAYRSANYPAAVEHFKQAVELDPEFNTARLYLATAYMSQWIPGAESPENVQMAKAAKENFSKVLESSPNDPVAIASMASMSYQEAGGIQDIQAKNNKLDEAREWNERLVKTDPKNKEAYYSLGVIAWAKWYPAYGKARADLGMKPEDPGPLKDKKVREELRAKWWDTVQGGIANLEKALEVDKNYDDAMAYLNLLYRERADLADTPEEARKDVDTADSWLQKALDTRKAKAEAASEGGFGAVAPAQ